jgi:hypothetical protein
VVEIVRYSMVPVIAAAMSVVGWQLMAHFPAVWVFDSVSFGLILPSILLWMFLLALVRRTNMAGAVAIGLLSPLIGGFLLGGPSGVGIVLAAWPAALLTGAVTGLLIHCCLFWDHASRRRPAEGPGRNGPAPELTGSKQQMT